MDRNVPLLDQHFEKTLTKPQNEEEILLQKEKGILEEIRNAKALKASIEITKNITYEKPLKTGWKAPSWVCHRSEEDNEKIRRENHILLDGVNIPPPCLTFKEMKLPKVIVEELYSRNIEKPNSFQIQALPVLLSGRDMIGIASTGSGKTLVFSLPLIMFSWEQEVKLPFEYNEGPFGLILCPSRDLAEQTYQEICSYAEKIEKYKKIKLITCLCIGGTSRNDQRNSFKYGCHMMVATPGRLLDNLKRNIFSLNICRYLCLDEADRMLENFEEELRTILTYFTSQRQTVFFSATMPRKIHEFALSAMVHPITVNVSGRAGAANKHITQDVEYVKENVKKYHLLNAIGKTPPPVIIFIKQPREVDEIHRFLLMKGLNASAIHGQKPQEERSQAVNEFRANNKDILLATDVASKGLDFKKIKHVINYEMPENIEDYTHRIGRTGRRGEKGLATTFVNRNVDETTLIDLKLLLKEAGQEIPEYLKHLGPVEETQTHAESDVGCAVCGGLGHRVINCPKLSTAQAKQTQSIGRNYSQGNTDW